MIGRRSTDEGAPIDVAAVMRSIKWQNLRRSAFALAIPLTFLAGVVLGMALMLTPVTPP